MASCLIGWSFLSIPIVGMLAALGLRHLVLNHVSQGQRRSLLSLFRTPSLINSVVFMCLGMAWVNISWQQAYQQALSLDQGRVKMQLTGKVARVSEQGYRRVFDFYPNKQIPFKKIKVSCYTCPINIKAGQAWRVALKLKPFVSFHNPDGFDYRKWMLTKGYGAQGFVDIKSTFNGLAESPELGLSAQVNDLLIGSQFPFLRALLLGDKQNIDSQVKRFITASGIGHLFVVSGLHVGVIALFASFLVAFLQRPLLVVNWPFSVHVSLLCGAMLALFYGYLSGFNVPALRACLMLLLGVVFILKGQMNSLLHYFLWALWFVLMIYPLAFMDMGSWLSFLIVLVLLLGFSNGSKAAGAINNFVWALVRTQWLAFLSGGLVLLSFYQALAPVGFVLNLMLVPLMAILLLPLSFLALLLGLLGWPDALVFMEATFHYLFQYLLNHQALFTWWPVVHEYSRYLFLLVFVLLLLPRAFHLRRLAFSVLLVAFLLPVNKPHDGAFELLVLDVGQGSSALIRTHSKNILVDTGLGFKNGMGLADYVVLPQLRRLGIRSLDLLHLTHDDKDHAGGRALLESSSLMLTEQSDCPFKSWVWDGVLFEQFQAAGFKEGNNGSCLLKVSNASGQSVLFSGDIEKEAELALLKQYAVSGVSGSGHQVNTINEKSKYVSELSILTADILVVPHHGSRTSSHERFIEAVNPKIAMISAGAFNRYGHPHEQVLTRYESKTINIYSSAVHGAMLVSFGARQAPLVVSTYRPKYR